MSRGKNTLDIDEIFLKGLAICQSKKASDQSIPTKRKTGTRMDACLYQPWGP
jgi:hypothetical protein